ncbi:MAG: hypothetical protein WAM82_28920, partial [Thermoanaerobaculia bacterium]
DSIELEPPPPAPVSFPAAAVPPPPPPPPPIMAPEPYDHEPSFALEPDPTYHVEEEPVFELEESPASFGAPGNVFSAPSELSFEEPHDRYLPEEPAAPAAPAPQAAGFDWAAVPEEPPQAWTAPAPEPMTSAAPAAAPAAGNGSGHLSDGDVDRIARRVVELLGDKTVRDVAWEVIPDLAEVIIRDRLRELESQVE